jgi:hypothetical protein
MIIQKLCAPKCNVGKGQETKKKIIPDFLKLRYIYVPTNVWSERIGKRYMTSGADWLPKFWWDFFSRGPQKNYWQNKNADVKKKKGH